MFDDKQKLNKYSFPVKLVKSTSVIKIMSEIQVIGAGFGRTGTMTLKVALEELGFGPCYHMKEVLFKNKITDWTIIESGHKSDAEKDKLLKKALQGYQASVDFPSAAYFKLVSKLYWHYSKKISDISSLIKEQMKLYPDAKVLLSVRDSPAAWVKSVKATIFRSRLIQHRLIYLDH